MYIDRPKQRRAGMSLVEMMIAMAIGGIVMSAVASLSWYTGRSFVALANYAELDAQSRNTLDRMSQKIRQASGLLEYDEHEVTFLYNNGASKLIYTYDPDTRILTEILDDEKTELLTECDTLNFQIFSRNPIFGDFAQFPVTTDAAAAKLIQFSWTCSRTILGNKVNTESIQSAKIVIRKQ
jgi:prepilin-type N-terminal cleavage/methylation domain-containing protein